MELAVDRVGTTYGGHTEVLDAQRARAYAAATNDGYQAYRDGALVPPVFGVVPAWGALRAVLADVVPVDQLRMIVHGEQDMHFRRPLVAGTRLTTRGALHSVRPGGAGTLCTIQLRSEDAASGDLVLDQYVTLFVRGTKGAGRAGPDKPDHRFPADARSRPVGELSVHVDDDQTFRYRDASGDDMAIHVDEEVARSVGLPGIILHGLCTLAMAGQAVLALAADGDPSGLRRLAARFAGHVLPGEDVVTTVYDAGPAGSRRIYAFEAHSGGRRVLAHGRAELD